MERVDVLEVEVLDDPDVSRQPLQTAGWSQEALVLAGVVLSHLQSEFSTTRGGAMGPVILRYYIIAAYNV